MLNRRTEYIEKIEEKFTQWNSLIKIRGKSGLYDLHKHSENNIRDILNILYGWNLKNLGVNSPTFPIIDLGDAENKVCFQVTANKTDECYKELESRFISSPLKLKEIYQNLHVFILSGMIDDRKGLQKALSKTGLSEERIYDFKSVLDTIRDLPNEEDYKLDKILHILDKNYISIKYFDNAITSYKDANQGRFSVESSFIEPLLIEEEKNPYAKKKKDSVEEDRNGELKAYSEREISKISFSGAWNETPQYILTGDPGSGKSELLKNSFNKMLEDKSSVTPVYIDLSKDRKEETVLELLHSEFNKYVKEQEGISKKVLVEELATQLLNYDSVYFFFDGYDEMTKKDLNKWNECIRSFLKTHAGVKVVIAVRKNRIVNDIVVPVTKIYGLLPFDHEQMSKYIVALLKENGQAADEGRVNYIKTKISESRLFLTAPTLVVKMLIQYAALQKTEDIHIAQTKSEAYQNYFDHIILKKLRSTGFEDPVETIPGSYNALKVETFKLLSEIAYNNFKGIYEPINYGELNRILEGLENKNNHKFLYQKGKNFLERELQVVRIGEPTKIYFNHYTYQEYFFAIWLKERVKPFSPALNWCRSAYVNPKYNQVFVFLVGLMNEEEVDIFFTRLLRWPLRFWMRIIKPLDQVTLTKFYFLAEMASESKLSEKDKNAIAERLIEELRPRNDINFEKACRILTKLSPGNETVLKKIIESVKSFSSWVRKQGLKIYVLPEIHRKPEFKKCIVDLLELPPNERFIRAVAIELLKEGRVFDDAVRDKILELHFLKKEEDNENDGFRYMTEYAKVYPEKCVDYAKKYLERVSVQHEDSKAHEPLLLFIKYYFAHVMHVPGYNEEELEKEVINFIENEKVTDHKREILLQAFYKTGIRNEKIIKLLIKKLDENGPLSTAIFMYFRDLYIVRPEIIEHACQYLYSEDREAARRAMNYLSQIRYDGDFIRNGKKIRIAERALEIITEGRDEGTRNPARGYAAEYLGHIKYTEGNTTSFMIGRLNNKDDSELHGYAVRYLMNTRYYSPSFFKYMFNNGNGLGGYSFESNEYFENIEKHVPENKITDAKMEMGYFFAIRAWDHIKQLRKKENDANGEDWWAEGAEESFKRTALAFQKLVLYGDEAKRVKNL